LAIALLAAPSSVSAHGLNGESDVRFAQTIAGMELAVVVRASTHLPAPLNVDVVAYSPVQAAKLDLTVRSLETGAASSDVVRLASGQPGSYPAELAVDRVGPHELELRVGDERSVLPFRVLLPRPQPWEVVIYGGYACAAVLLIAGLVAAALSRKALSITLGAGLLVAVTVAFTTAALSSQFAPAQDTATRPNAQLALDVRPGLPDVGEDLVLRIRLYDGSTGRPVDDLVEHHAALLHVIVTGPEGEFFRHVHPARTAPGTYEVRLRAGAPGRHFVHAEFERADAGGQLTSGEFTVGNDDRPAEPPRREPNQPISLTAEPVAGRPTGIELDTKADDLQPWLGMAGHLIVRSEDGKFLGHVHEQTSMTTTRGSGPDESVAVYGPKLQFTFSFPRPGRYLIWIQYARNFGITTVPAVVDVAAAERGGA
jgi:hypothetical protein